MMKTAAVIGCGRAQRGKVGWAIGHQHANGILNAYPDVELHGVDIDESNLQAFGEKFGVPPERLHRSTEALYQKVTPEAIGLATWPTLHGPQLMEAVGHGVRAILCEKPMATDVGEIERMLDLCRRKQVALAIAHQRRHEARYQLARQLISEGRFGEQIVLHARVGDDWDMLSWTVHWFDMANFLFSALPEYLLAGVHHEGERRYLHAVESASVVFAQYPEARQALFTTGPSALIQHGFMIEGSAAMGRFREDHLLLLSDDGVEQVPYPAEPEIGPYGSIYRELGEHLAKGTPILCDAEQTAWGTRMAFAAHESAVYQRKVVLTTQVQFPPLEILQHPRIVPSTPRKVTLVADRHHQDPTTGLSSRDGLLNATGALGYPTRLVPVEEREIEAADLADAEVLMISHTKLQSSPGTRQHVGDWIRGGRPTVIVHCGIGAWADWQEFRQWIGRYWVWPAKRVPADAELPPSRHPFVECAIQNLAPERLATGWSEGWLPADEVYHDLAEGDPIDLLATTKIEGEAQPIAWQSRKHPHLTVWLPGHRPDLWNLEVMRDGLRAVTELAIAAGNRTA